MNQSSDPFNLRLNPIKNFWKLKIYSFYQFNIPKLFFSLLRYPHHTPPPPGCHQSPQVYSQAPGEINHVPQPQQQEGFSILLKEEAEESSQARQVVPIGPKEESATTGLLSVLADVRHLYEDPCSTP